MKANLTFDLTNEDDIVSFKRASKSNEMALAIYEFQYHTMFKIQNDTDIESFDREELIGYIFEIFEGIIEENNINIDDLV